MGNGRFLDRDFKAGVPVENPSPSATFVPLWCPDLSGWPERKSRTLWGTSAWRLIKRHKLPIHWDGSDTFLVETEEAAL